MEEIYCAMCDHSYFIGQHGEALYCEVHKKEITHGDECEDYLFEDN